MLAFDFYGTYSKYKDPFENIKDYEDFVNRVKKDYNIPQCCKADYHSIIFNTCNRDIAFYWCLYREDCRNGREHLRIRIHKTNADLVSLDEYLIDGYIGDIR